MSKIIHDEMAEDFVLGTCVVWPQSLDDVADILEPQHFGRQHHQAIYKALLALHAAGKAIDYITVAEQVEKNGDGALADRAAVYSISTNGIPRGHVKAHAQRIKERALLRDLRALGHHLIAESESAEAEAAAVLEQAESQLFALGHQTASTEWVSGAELFPSLYETLETMQTSGAVVGLPTGFRDLDRKTRGLQKGDLTLVGARPSMGKTSFGLQVALQAAQSVPVAFFSVEMAVEPLALRAVINASDVDGFRLMSGQPLSEVENRRVSDGLTTLANAAVFFDESPSLSPVQVRTKLRRLKARTGVIGLVVIDYLQLMAPLPEHRKENKTNQVAGISRALKIMAREFQAPFLVLSQLNRATEGRGDKRPTMSDLRDSGALEQDADVILLLHRPHYYDAMAPADLAEVILAKQRNGPTGLIKLTWQAQQMKFGSGYDERRAG